MRDIECVVNQLTAEEIPEKNLWCNSDRNSETGHTRFYCQLLKQIKHSYPCSQNKDNY